MRFSCFRVLPGSTEALVRWGGKIKYHLTSYFLVNIPAKKYQNRLMLVEVIASQSSVVFWRHSVVANNEHKLFLDTINFCRNLALMGLRLTKCIELRENYARSLTSTIALLLIVVFDSMFQLVEDCITMQNT